MALVGVGGPTAGYRANVTVVDNDGDGQVTLTFDTGAAGGGDAFSVGSDDTFRVEDATSLEEPGLGETELSLSVSVGGLTRGTAALVVREPVDRTTATPTATATPTPSDETPAGETPSATPTSSPGFGPVVAAGALAAAALLARRR